MPTLFLDIDGVLNSEPFLRHQRNHTPPHEQALCDSENLRALEELCRAADIQHIVIASSWRVGRSVKELRYLLTREGFAMPGRIEGATGDAPDTPEGRAAAIRAFVQMHQIAHFLVLDDYPLGTMPGGVVVQCNPNQGLTREHVSAIVERLKETRES